MVINEVQEYIAMNPICSFATIENNKPKVRMFWVWFVDNDGIFFHTPTTSPAFAQMKSNNNVELCFYSDNESIKGKMLRISGKVEFIKSLALNKKLLEDRPFLKSLGSGNYDDPIFGVFMIPFNTSEITFKNT